ncbi:RdgB/HAM1 family non-canonical purine NTP pyrophosphatase [Campylobacter estrildidarum]|uniref:dITP/XTP pyrophosphatase n=1 Tax=Campylobacter estrildidarum TaxID=2510189 RepID=A0A4U7BFW5_9BACT|nr:RdgB/HAM1 family non-canonical purine NTP pyrophosphatase [Campylobacter estrildidarum]TKX30568.1 non-canonical purine NTP pyrophosphatase, RdgB/HAM1 family [Campylobacter estrildidarum]
MKILLATSNKHKVFEIKEILKDYKLYAFDEVLKPFEIEENGKSFKENALIKARAVFNALVQKQKNEFLVLSDDSGICVEVLDGKPGIYSARFSNKGDDKSNREKLISEIKQLGVCESKAYYIAAIAIVSSYGEYVVQASMHGKVMSEERGENGFGYDSLFIPNGFDKTLAQLSSNEKNTISHRFKALELALIILKMIKKGKKGEKIY